MWKKLFLLILILSAQCINDVGGNDTTDGANSSSTESSPSISPTEANSSSTESSPSISPTEANSSSTESSPSISPTEANSSSTESSPSISPTEANSSSTESSPSISPTEANSSSTESSPSISPTEANSSSTESSPSISPTEANSSSTESSPSISPTEANSSSTESSPSISPTEANSSSTESSPSISPTEANSSSTESSPSISPTEANSSSTESSPSISPTEANSSSTESSPSISPTEANSSSTESSPSISPTEANSSSTETRPSTSPTEALTTVNVSNDRTAINGKLLLQKSLALSNKINSLTNQIYSLEAAINSTNSPYFTQLNQMSEQAIKMNATLATLLENLDVQLKRQNAVDIQVANITRMYACMAASSCVTKKPTTTVPTTTYPLSVCPDVNPPPATPANQTISVNETENVYCTAAFSSPVNTSIDLYVDVAINGSNAALNIKNAVTGDLIMNFTNSDTGFVETGSKSVVIVYSADRYSSIGFDITYNTVTSDPCSDYPCDAKGGKCMVVPSTGLPYCQCNACYSGQNCSTVFDPCTATANRLCKNKGQICAPNPNVTDYCGYVCLSTTTTQGLAPTIATLTSWLQSWKIW